MTYEVTNAAAEINLQPPNERTEILQNVRCILNSVKMSVPLMRGFGVDSNLVDYPINIAQNKIAADLAEQIAEYEPRATLKKVICRSNLDGSIFISAVVDL